MNKPHSEQSFLIRDSIANVLRMSSLIAISVGLFAVASGSVMIYLNLTGQLELERADRAATQQADRIAAELADIQTSLRDASVVDAARSATANGAGSNEALRAALRERGVTSILDARALPGRIDAFAVNEDIDLDFATTEMVIEAIRDQRAEISVLQAGTPSESLVFAQRMPGESGVLLLRLTVSVVTSLLQPNEMLDFVALAQRGDRAATVLGVSGRPATARIREIPVAGSSLVLQWSRAVARAPLDNRAAVILGSSGIIVLMVGLLLRRRTRLARYLAHPVAQTEARPERVAAKAPSRAGSPTRRRAQKTMVLGSEEAADSSDNDRSRVPDPAPEPAPEDEPPTMVAPSPNLPEWLRDDVDAGLDELAPDDDPDSSQPGTGTLFNDPGSDDDDELLEDFDTYQGVDPSLFRPDGVHGKATQELTVPDMVILGQAIGSEAVEQGLRRICVAYDGRESGPDLLAGLARGLSVCGIDVIELGAVPAPVAWFAAMRMQHAGAVMITGGNRPEEINGLEIVFDGLWLGREERRSLLDRIRNQEFATGAGERSAAEEAANYCEQISANHRLQRPLRVVLDCGNAVNGALAPELFESLGVDVIPLNADPETRAEQVANFDANERLQDLQLCVENFAADLGISLDRTGSRLHVVGPDGKSMDSARLAALLSGDLAEHGQATTLLADKALAARLEDVAELTVTAFDGEIPEMQRALRERDAALAVHSEGSVCVAADWHGLPDAIHAAAWLLAVLAADGRPVPEILSPAQSGPRESDRSTPTE